MSTRIDQALILCGLLSVAAGCGKPTPTAPVVTPLSQAQSAADAQSFIARRLAVQRATGISDEAIKPLERIYESGTLADWMKLEDKEKSITCMLHQYRPGHEDDGLALCFAGVWESDVLATRVAKSDLPVASTSLRTLMIDYSYVPLVITQLQLKSDAVKGDPKHLDRLYRAEQLNKLNR